MPFVCKKKKGSPTKGLSMKGILKFVATAFLLAIPIAGECRTVAFSPSIPGQPLIFHFNTAYNEIQPSHFSALTWTQLENALLIRSSYTQHLQNMPTRNCCYDPCNVWVDGMGQWQHQNTGDHNQFGFNDITGGVTVGADRYFNDLTIGIAASYTNSHLRWKESVGDGRIDSYYGGLYGAWNTGCFYLNGSVLGAYNDYHTSRHFHFRNMDHRAHGRHHGWEVLTGLEAGATLQELFCNIDLVPFVRVDYIYLSQQAFDEDGADRFNLHINKRDNQLIQSEVGFQFTRRMLCELCSTNWTIAPNLSLSYINQASLNGRTFHTNFIGRDHVFDVKGWNFNRNLGAIAFNVNFLNCTETFNFTLHYDGQFGKNYWNQTGSLMCNICF